MRRRSTDPNLSKDHLRAMHPKSGIPHRPGSFYAENNIDLRLGPNVAAIDVRSREVALGDDSRAAYDRLLLATGSEPIRLVDPRRRSAACAYLALAGGLPRPGFGSNSGIARPPERP